MRYKDFDWENFRQHTNQRKYDWFLENHAKTVSEERFIAEMKVLKQFSGGAKVVGGKRKRYWHSHYTPSTLRKTYKNLKTRFGFFV